MQAWARKLVKAGRLLEAPVFVRKAGEQSTDAGFTGVERVAAELLAQGAGSDAITLARKARVERMLTARELGKRSVSGQLHRSYPDQIALKRTAHDDEVRLNAHIYPIIGDKRVDEVTSTTASRSCAASPRAQRGRGDTSREPSRGHARRRSAGHSLGLASISSAAPCDSTRTRPTTRAAGLDGGTARALRVYGEHFCPRGWRGSSRLSGPTGRAHLEVRRRRPAERHRIRVHDLRGTFVTLSLANGRSESWIADRTRHPSSAMINRYKRTARSFAELELGSPDPLIEALPELLQLESPSTGSRPPASACSAECAGERGFLNDSKRPQRDSNPCYSLERAVSWAGLDDGD
jgi:hypothetical protein